LGEADGVEDPLECILVVPTDWRFDEGFGREVRGSMVWPVRRETMARSVDKAASTQAVADLDCSVGMRVSGASEQWLDETNSTIPAAFEALS